MNALNLLIGSNQTENEQNSILVKLFQPNHIPYFKKRMNTNWLLLIKLFHLNTDFKTHNISFLLTLV